MSSAHKYLCTQVVVTFEQNLLLTNELRTLECSRTHECQTFVSRPITYLTSLWKLLHSVNLLHKLEGWSSVGLETNVWHSRVREHSRVRSSFVSNRFCSNVTTTCIHKYLWAELIVISFKISYCTYDLAHFEHNSIYVSFQMNVIDTLTKLKRTFAFKLYFICVWYGKS